MDREIPKTAQRDEVDYDVIIIGGGLSGSVTAYWLKKKNPDIKLLLLDKNTSHSKTWSLHAEEISREALGVLQKLGASVWPEYDIAFPSLGKKIQLPYLSIRASELIKNIHQELKTEIRETSVQKIGVDFIELENGKKIKAPWIFDARGESENVPCGYQKFLGLELKLKKPHGLKAPVLMDACVEQKEGFRFFYTIPWSETRLLVEDTRYTLSPEMNKDEFKDEVLEYAKARWQVESVVYEEKGCLPIPLLSSPQKTSCLGYSGGFFNPTTGYSFGIVVNMAEYLSYAWKNKSQLDFSSFYASEFYFYLNRLLFLGGIPEGERYKLLEKFYRLPTKSILRFYASKFNLYDKLKLFLLKKPPMSILRAIKLLKGIKPYEFTA